MSTLGTDFAQGPNIDVTFVRMGDGSERIWESGAPRPAYPIPTGETLAAAAAAVDGTVLEEGQVSEARLRSGRPSGQARRHLAGSRETARR